MSVERISLDANVLFYAVDADAGERHVKAREIVRLAASHDCILTLQTLGEFTEDLQHDRVLEGVRFRNPFLVQDPFAASS
jgi:predicted nucleic acid-binding protein